MKARFGLLDAYTILDGAKGSRFTWRKVINDRLVQSRLDKFYLSVEGWWVRSFRSLIHVADQILSNHDPIRLLIQIDLPLYAPSSARKSSYFKANPLILNFAPNLATLQSAWRSELQLDLDARYRFHLASRRLRSMFQGIQEEFNKLDQTIE